MNHALLPSVPNAPLPATYEAATLAIRECNRLDECKDWSDKAEAMASYCRQANDKEMMKMAMRIRLRAERRLGQLYEEFVKSQGGRKKTGDSESPVTRTEMAAEIGQTKDQMIRSVRAARVPDGEFEEQLESDNPPTITSLAEQGMEKRKGKPVYEQRGMTEKAWKAGMYFRGHLDDMAAHTEEFDPQDVAEGSTPEQREQIRRNITTIEEYLTKLKANL